LELPGSKILARSERSANEGIVADLDGDRVRRSCTARPEITIFTAGASHQLELREFETVQDEEVGGRLTAPMPAA
jgi:hypothetical protein